VDQAPQEIKVGDLGPRAPSMFRHLCTYSND